MLGRIASTHSTQNLDIICLLWHWYSCNLMILQQKIVRSCQPSYLTNLSRYLYNFNKSQNNLYWLIKNRDKNYVQAGMHAVRQARRQLQAGRQADKQAGRQAGRQDGRNALSWHLQIENHLNASAQKGTWRFDRAPNYIASHACASRVWTPLVLRGVFRNISLFLSSLCEYTTTLMAASSS